MTRPRLPLLFALLVLGARAPAQAPQTPAVPRAWEHESSDLPPDPALRFGAFENGVRWAWARNSEPRERSYLRLHVNAGSLAEEDSERGMAHFLEHMAFNGSEHFEPGTLVEWFQRHGMAFGADLNAETGFGETIYKLDLPTSDEKTLDEGLLVLADFAFRLTLSAEEIEAEKGVIDGEERERDSPGFRLLVRQLETMFGATRLDDRIPIGVRETRAKFTAESVRAFYARWYRPKNMTLVLVGDLGELDPVPLFEKHFGSVSPPSAPLVAEPGPGAIGADFPKRISLHEPEIPSVTLSLDRLRPWASEPFVAEKWRADLPLAVAYQMLDLRFAEAARAPSAPFLAIRGGSEEAFDVVELEDLSITCAPEKWKDALAAGEQGLRRALEHGFRAAELAEVRADALRGLDEAVERERTRSSASLVGEVLAAAESRYVPTSAATDRSILRPAYEALTPEACQAALVEAWSRGELVVVTTGKLDLGADAGGELDEALAASRAVPVEKPAELESAGFAYAAGEEAGEIAERRTVEDLDLVLVRFANGVALNVKRTDFKEEQILVRAKLGEGHLSMAPADVQPLTMLVSWAFHDGGLVAHSIDDIRRLTAGKEVGMQFGVDVESLDCSGATTQEDLLLQLELLCAYLVAPGWREDGLVRMRRNLPLTYEGLARQHRGPLMRDFPLELYGGDPRFAFPPQEVMEKVGIPELRAWLEPVLADAPLDVTLVGDLDVEQAIAAAARTLGKLPKRREPRAYAERRVAPQWKDGVAQTHEIDTEVPKSLVVLSFPVGDGIDAERRRRVEFLGTVVNDRLRLEVRERLGASYSPGAGAQASRTYPGMGSLSVQAMAEPAEAEKLVEACLAVTDALAAKGVTDEEVARLKEPALKGLRDARRNNAYWLAVLAEAQRRPASLDEQRGQLASIEGMSAAELTKLAEAHLGREHVARVVVSPRAKPAQPAEPADASAPKAEDGPK